MDPILARGRMPAYRRGARYLGWLANLAQSVTEWPDFTPHAEYMAGPQSRHGRKTSFWARWREVVG